MYLFRFITQSSPNWKDEPNDIMDIIYPVYSPCFSFCRLELDIVMLRFFLSSKHIEPIMCDKHIEVMRRATGESDLWYLRCLSPSGVVDPALSSKLDAYQQTDVYPFFSTRHSNTYLSSTQALDKRNCVWLDYDSLSVLSFNKNAVKRLLEYSPLIVNTIIRKYDHYFQPDSRNEFPTPEDVFPADVLKLVRNHLGIEVNHG